MDTAPEDRNIVDLMVGQKVLVEYLAGPHPAKEDEEKLLANEALIGQPEARTRLAWLTGYSSLGIEVEYEDDDNEDNAAIFVSWGAVLRIRGYSRAELERNAKEAAERKTSSEDSEAASPT